MDGRSVFRTAVRTPSAQMDADFSTLHAPEAAGEGSPTAVAPFGSRRDCVRAVTVRASHLSRAIERQVRGAYELQCGDRSNDLNKLPKASCRHRNTLLVVFP